MRGAEKLFDAITGVREDLIEEALDHRFARRASPWKRYAALAACLLFVVGLGVTSLRYGLLPAMGGSGKNTSATQESNAAAGDSSAPESQTDDGCTPEEMPQPEPPAADAGGTVPGEEITFLATVVEAGSGWLLVEPEEGEEILNSADRIQVPTGELAELPELAAGDRVRVTYSGEIQETYPARLTEVLAVEKLVS